MRDIPLNVLQGIQRTLKADGIYTVVGLELLFVR